jgi:hypothetical protein
MMSKYSEQIKEEEQAIIRIIVNTSMPPKEQQEVNAEIKKHLDRIKELAAKMEMSRGGSATTEAKIRAARENGKKGSRPKNEK